MENRSFYNEILTEHNIHPEFKHDIPDADIALYPTGSKFKVPQVLSRTEIKNLTRPGVNKRQFSF